MIINKKGDLLKANDCEAIAHQTNTIGAFGAGIAKQIRDKWDGIYEKYKKVCLENVGTDNLIGKVQCVHTNDTSIKYVFNLFSQRGIGGAQTPFPKGRNTDYDALRMCLNKVKDYCKTHNIHNIGLPKYMSCCLAGGDWDGVVYPMIEEIFAEDKDLKVYIYDYSKT